LAGDDRVRSRSVGDGLYKKIKIYPVKVAGRESERDLSGDEQGFSENEGRGRPNDGGSDFAGTV